jgi:hypothetical protein
LTGAGRGRELTSEPREGEVVESGRCTCGRLRATSVPRHDLARPHRTFSPRLKRTRIGPLRPAGS